MKGLLRMFLLVGFLVSFVFACSSSDSDAGSSGVLKPVAGQLQIPLAKVSDGKAHHYQVKADDGTMVTFFILKSRDASCWRKSMGIIIQK